MIKSRNLKKGSAIAFCLTFATVLLVMGMAFARLTMNNKKQTVQIDERIKLDYLAQGMTELAILKFQLYPADFYACIEASSKYKKDEYLEKFTVRSEEFTIRNDKNSYSSFNDTGINLQIASFTIFTENKWKDEVLYVEATANYTDQYGKIINKTVKRVVNLERKSHEP